MLVIVFHIFVCAQGLEMIDYSANSFGWNYHIFMEQKQSFLPFFDDTNMQLFSQVEASDYNPVQHERGFHKKLNMLVKESLQFGYIYSLSCLMFSKHNLFL